MRIAIGSDHAGYDLKAHLVAFLRDAGHDVVDAGTDSAESVDYPAYCAAVARAVAAGAVDRGIVMGGSGQGEQLAANAVRGVRAALCNDLFTARLSRLHNDANVLSIGGRVVGTALAEEIATTWLATEFEGDRHVRRVEQLAELASLSDVPDAQDALIDRLAPGATARARGEGSPAPDPTYP
ncbi:MAG TPA: ribose 5-phosphate isomerase B [Acidimicrobiales bacterium]|nr:ribose 5-phosphate isomerase B [Acidimicrobiales bacterium]